MAGKIIPLPFLPAGVTVDVTVTFPKDQGGMCEGLRFKVDQPLGADDARRRIGRELFSPVLDQLLLPKATEPS